MVCTGMTLPQAGAALDDLRGSLPAPSFHESFILAFIWPSLEAWGRKQDSLHWRGANRRFTCILQPPELPGPKQEKGPAHHVLWGHGGPGSRHRLTDHTDGAACESSRVGWEKRDFLFLVSRCVRQPRDVVGIVARALLMQQG